MNCCNILPHNEMSAWLKANYYDGGGKEDKDDGKRMMVQLSHYGLVVAKVQVVNTSKSMLTQHATNRAGWTAPNNRKMPLTY
jgi:hypothetical protein